MWRLSVLYATGIARDCITWVYPAVFVAFLTKRTSVGKGIFEDFQKYLRPRRHSPKEWRFRFQAINLPPPRKGLKPMGWPPEPRGISSAEAPPVRSVPLTTRPTESNNCRGSSNTGVWYAVFVIRPTTGQVWHKSFLRWVRGGIGKPPDALLMCIYAGGRVHNVGSTTVSKLFCWE